MENILKAWYAIIKYPQKVEVSMGKTIITKPVVGYEGLYEVNNLGQVFSLFYYGKPRRYELRSNPDKDGYYKVSFCKNGKYITIGVHRAVAKAFIPNPNSLPQVNHKDLDPSNNRLENLEWCTCKYNIRYSWERNKKIGFHRGENNPATTLKNSEVIAIWVLKNKLQPIKIGELFGVSNKVVWNIHHQRKWKWLTDGC